MSDRYPTFDGRRKQSADDNRRRKARNTLRDDAIREMWETHTLNDIAAAVGLCRERVRQIGYAIGLRPKNLCKTEAVARRNEIKRKIRDGRNRTLRGQQRRIAEVETLLGEVSDYEVAARTGVPPQTIYNYRRQVGIAGVGHKGMVQPATRSGKKGEAAYKMRQRGAKWRDICVRLRLTNACSAAKDYALRRNLQWPIVLDVD